MNGLFITLVLLAGAVSSSAFFFFPDIEGFASQLAAAFTFLILLTQILAVWSFLTSLSAFRKKLRTAYYILSLGLLLSSFTQIQLPVVLLFPIDPIVSSWAAVIPALLGTGLMYVAIRMFARILDLHKWYESPVITGGIALVAAVASAFLPHIDTGVSELTVDGIFGTFIASAVFGLIAALLALNIRKALSDVYKTSLGWLVAGLLTISFGAVHETIIKLLPALTENLSFGWYYEYGVSLWPYVLAALFFLKAGLSFKATSKQYEELPEDSSYLDVINYTASKASDPSKIDTILDKVRQITALQKPGSPLNSAEKSTLLGVYLQLEAYLTTKEPLRTYSQDKLRASLPENFQAAIVKHKS